MILFIPCIVLSRSPSWHVPSFVQLQCNTVYTESNKPRCGRVVDLNGYAVTRKYPFSFSFSNLPLMRDKKRGPFRVTRNPSNQALPTYLFSKIKHLSTPKAGYTKNIHFPTLSNIHTVYTSVFSALVPKCMRVRPVATHSKGPRVMHFDEDHLHKLTLSELRRYDELRLILGTGFSLQRRVARVQKVQELFDEYTPPAGDYVRRQSNFYVETVHTHGNDFDVFRGQKEWDISVVMRGPSGGFTPYILKREISEDTGPTKETSIEDYRKHAREMHGIRRKLFGYVPGLEYPQDSNRYPPSPFGPPETRFRKMAASPWAERTGFIQTYRYH